MPHADSSYVPTDIRNKAEFYAHIHLQLLSLLEDTPYWVTNLAQASSLLYHSYLSSPLYGINADAAEPHTPVVNWVGFYLHPPPYSSDNVGNIITGTTSSSGTTTPPRHKPLLLGPYNGRPACQYISLPTRPSPRGVCAEAFLSDKGVVVQDVEKWEGHIACDATTQSEIVLPLTIPILNPGSNSSAGPESHSKSDDRQTRTIGVLDLDSTVLATFDEDDLRGLQGVVDILREGCDWA